ncbi:MAG: hypothetical protein ABSB29_06280 [Nitrososphaerales archaeon]
MKARFQFATVCYCAAIFMTFGFVAITVAMSYSSALNGNTNLYLTIWGDSVIMIVLGLALILAAFLVSSSKASRLAVGGILGVGFSVLGTLVAIDLVDTLVGFQGWPYAATGSFFEDVLTVCLLAVLLVGFPLGLMGSLGGIRNSQAAPDSANSEDTAAGESKNPDGAFSGGKNPNKSES